MPTPIRTPRINNNDDIVRFTGLLAEIGSKVRAGDPIVDIETDKATFTVESTLDGYLLAVNGKPGEDLAVGSILAWIGDSADEKIESAETNGAGPATKAEPTLKALLLLRQYGLDASKVPASGARLTAEDVERYASSRGVSTPAVARPASTPLLTVPGKVVPLSPEERGMLKTVTWHRDEAAAGYVELAYDPGPWEEYAGAFQKKHGLLLSPLLPLMSWQLTRLAAQNPRWNATVTADGAYLYEQVNLGFTVQAGSNLYLVVVRDTQPMAELDFVRELGKLQQAAMKHDVKPDQLQGATIAFSSMARWKVTRHVPLLPPNTGLIVAHTAVFNGAANLGVTYDHRLLTGFDAVQLLQQLSAPASADQESNG